MSLICSFQGKATRTKAMQNSVGVVSKPIGARISREFVTYSNKEQGD